MSRSNRATGVGPLRQRMPRYHDFLGYKHGLPVLSLALYLNVGLEGRGFDLAEEVFLGETLGTTRWPYLGLPALDAFAYVEGGNLLGVALSVLTRADEADQPRLKARAMQRLAEAKPPPYRLHLLMGVVEAYLPLHGPRMQDFQDLLMTKEYEMGRVLAKTSFELGEERGEERGEARGERKIVVRQLEKRFGTLSADVLRRIEAWPVERLGDLGEALLSAASLAELGLEDAP